MEAKNILLSILFILHCLISLNLKGQKPVQKPVKPPIKKVVQNTKVDSVAAIAEGEISPKPQNKKQIIPVSKGAKYTQRVFNIDILKMVPSGGFKVTDFNAFKSLIHIEHNDSFNNDGSLTLDGKSHGFKNGAIWIANSFDISGGYETSVTFNSNKNLKNVQLTINNLNFLSMQDDGSPYTTFDIVPELGGTGGELYNFRFLRIPNIFDGQTHTIKIRRINKVIDNKFFRGFALFIDDMTTPFSIGENSIPNFDKNNIHSYSDYDTSDKGGFFLQYYPNIAISGNSEYAGNDLLNVKEWKFSCFCEDTPNVTLTYSSYLNLGTTKYNIPNSINNNIVTSDDNISSSYYVRPYKYSYIDTFMPTDKLDGNKGIKIQVSLRTPDNENIDNFNAFKITTDHSNFRENTANISIYGAELSTLVAESGMVYLKDVTRYDGLKGKEISFSNITFTQFNGTERILSNGKFYQWQPIKKIDVTNNIDISKLCLTSKPSNSEIKCNSKIDDISKIWADSLLKYNTPTTPINLPITCNYAKLYLRNPDVFKWAGLAAIVSGKIGEGLDTWQSKFDIASNDYINLYENFTETIMQGNKDVYIDLYWQHIIFEKGGIECMKYYYDKNKISQIVYEAWKEIDMGIRNKNQIQIWDGNKALLNYEQKVVLKKMYDTRPEMWGIITKYLSKFIDKFQLSS